MPEALLAAQQAAEAVRNASGIATLLDSCKQHIEDCRARPARKTLSCQTLLRMLQEAVNATSSGISGWSSNAPSLPSQSGWGRLVDSFMINGTIDGMVAFQPERVGCVRAEKSRRRMAIHRTSDEISCNIAMHGQWEDCKALAKAWKLAMSYPRGRGYSNAPPLFVDIGANIGACTLHMLSCADLSVVAFEVNPKNMAVLARSLAANSDLQSRVVLYDMGLGDADLDAVPMAWSPANFGNTWLTGTTQPEPRAKITAKIRRLDDVLWPPGSQMPWVPLLKLDVEGNELNVLRGARRLLAAGAIKVMRTEVSPIWLRGQSNGTAEELHAMMLGYGYWAYLHITPDESGFSDPVENISSLRFGGGAYRDVFYAWLANT